MTLFSTSYESIKDPIPFTKVKMRNMTPLDKACAEATQEGKHSVFYNAFLSSIIFIPTLDVPASEQSRRAGENESIAPIIVESEGAKYLMLFDTKERLAAWAKREVGFAALPGHAIVEMMSADFHWALNAGTKHMKTFVPEEITWLKENSKKAQEQKIPAGTEVVIGAPSRIPAGLIESLKKNLSSRNSEVKAAYLGQVFYVREGEKPHLALVLDLQAKDRSVVEAVCRDLAVSTKGFLGDGEGIDIMVNDGKGTALEITRAVKPFYSKGGWLKKLTRR